MANEVLLLEADVGGTDNLLLESGDNLLLESSTGAGVTVPVLDEGMMTGGMLPMSGGVD